MEDTKKRYHDPSFIKSIDFYNERHKRNPRFVISTTATVPDHEFSEDSSDEEVDENFNQLYNQIICEKRIFPFTPDTKTTTKVKTEEIIPEMEVAPLNIPTDRLVAEVFLSKVLENAFDEHETNDKISTIAVCIGLNRMYSVSSRKNKSLNLKLQSVVNPQNISYETFGFYWRCKWYNYKNEEVQFEDVKSFYRKLKKVNPNSAEKFVTQEQKFATNRENIPYQDIRGYAKNHSKTKKLIKEFRQDDSNAIVYLSLIDADVCNFNGVYSAYLRIINSCHEIPTIMTTGYEFADESRAFELLSHRERMIRVITALYIPLGTYYPEPNMCVLVPPKCDTVPESFIDRKRGGGKTLESPILLTAILNDRGTAIRAIISEDSPITVAVPERAKLQKKSKTPIRFSDEFWKGPASPSNSDIKLYDQVSQSHSGNFTWLTGLFINNAIKYDSTYEPGIAESGANTIELPKRSDYKCKKLISLMNNSEDVDFVEQRKSELARLIGEEDANNIAKVIEKRKEYDEYFYKQHVRTSEEEALIIIMKKEKADFMKLPKGFLLRMVTSPIMQLIKNETVDIATLCKQDIEVVERFVDDIRIYMALLRQDVKFEDLIACLDQDIHDVTSPLAALIMKEDKSQDIVLSHPELLLKYALKNGYINDEDAVKIIIKLIVPDSINCYGDIEESAANQKCE